MALGDYILCCKCEDKLLYDGDRSNRQWWKERYGTEPEIKCPKCSAWQGLTDEEMQAEWSMTPQNDKAEGVWFGRRIEAKLKEKNHAN